MPRPGAYKMNNTKHETRATSNERRTTRHAPAFTFIEILIALAITAMILTTIAIAFNAAAMSYKQNYNTFKSVNNARQALLRITAQLRTASIVSTLESPTQCSFITAENQSITYLYDPSAKKLYLVTNDDLYDPDHLLCENVTAMTFTKALGYNPDPYVKNVQISITVKYADIEKTLATAVVIRKKLN